MDNVEAIRFVREVIAGMEVEGCSDVMLSALADAVLDGGTPDAVRISNNLRLLISNRHDSVSDLYRPAWDGAHRVWVWVDGGLYSPGQGSRHVVGHDVFPRLPGESCEGYLGVNHFKTYQTIGEAMLALADAISFTNITHIR